MRQVVDSRQQDANRYWFGEEGVKPSVQKAVSLIRAGEGGDGHDRRGPCGVIGANGFNEIKTRYVRELDIHQDAGRFVCGHEIHNVLAIHTANRPVAALDENLLKQFHV